MSVYNLRLGDETFTVPAWASESTFEKIHSNLRAKNVVSAKILQNFEGLDEELKANFEAIIAGFDSVGQDTRRENSQNKKQQDTTKDFAENMRGLLNANNPRQFVDEAGEMFAKGVGNSQTVKNLGDGLSRKFPKAMNIASVALKGFAPFVGIATDALFAYAGFLTASYKAFHSMQRDFINVGAVFADTDFDFHSVKRAAADANIGFKSLGELASKHAPTLAAAGGSVSKGIVQVLPILDDLNNYADAFGDFGLKSNEMYDEFLGFIETRRMAGMLDGNIADEGDSLIKEYSNLRNEISALSALTGAETSDLMASRLQALSMPDVAAARELLVREGNTAGLSIYDNFIAQGAEISKLVGDKVAAPATTLLNATTQAILAANGDISKVNIEAQLRSMDSGLATQLQTQLVDYTQLIRSGNTEQAKLFLFDMMREFEGVDTVAGQANSNMTQAGIAMRTLSTVLENVTRNIQNETKEERTARLNNNRAALKTAGASQVAATAMSELTKQLSAYFIPNLQSLAEVTVDILDAFKRFGNFLKNLIPNLYDQMVILLNEDLVLPILEFFTWVPGVSSMLDSTNDSINNARIRMDERNTAYQSEMDAITEDMGRAREASITPEFKKQVMDEIAKIASGESTKTRLELENMFNQYQREGIGLNDAIEGNADWDKFNENLSVLESRLSELPVVDNTSELQDSEEVSTAVNNNVANIETDVKKLNSESDTVNNNFSVVDNRLDALSNMLTENKISEISITTDTVDTTQQVNVEMPIQTDSVEMNVPQTQQLTPPGNSEVNVSVQSPETQVVTASGNEITPVVEVVKDIEDQARKLKQDIINSIKEQSTESISTSSQRIEQFANSLGQLSTENLDSNLLEQLLQSVKENATQLDENLHKLEENNIDNETNVELLYKQNEQLLNELTQYMSLADGREIPTVLSELYDEVQNKLETIDDSLNFNREHAEKQRKIYEAALRDMANPAIRGRMTESERQELSDIIDSYEQNNIVPQTETEKTLNIKLSAPGRAVGGPVSQNMPYIVGEEGEEAFVPTQNGVIINNDALLEMLTNSKDSAKLELDRIKKIVSDVMNNTSTYTSPTATINVVPVTPETIENSLVRQLAKQYETEVETLINENKNTLNMTKKLEQVVVAIADSFRDNDKQTSHNQ